jgi:hypothetical protein
VSVGPDWTISNANSQQQMGGLFHNLHVDVGLGLGVSLNVAWSDQANNSVNIGPVQFNVPTISVSTGAGGVAGASVSVFDTFTSFL